MRSIAGRSIVASALALALLASATVAQAPDQGRLDAARALMEATGGTDQARKVVDQMIAAMVDQVKRQSPADAGEFERLMRTVLAPESPKVKAYFAEIMDIGTRFYAENFTNDELAQITAFQKSPVGQKFNSLVPAMSAKMAPAMMKFQGAIMPDIQKAMQDAQAKKK